MREVNLVDDDADLDALWNQAVGRQWPLEPGRLAAVATGGMVIQGHRGLDAAALTNGTALVALLVSPSRQRRGLATALLDAVQPRSIGAGGDRYLWPGVPTNLPSALAFFQAAGWQEDHRVWDYVAPLPSYQALVLRPTPGVSYLPSDCARSNKAVAFNDEHFPRWSPYFAALPAHCAYLALDGRERVVATLLLEWSGAGDPGPWRKLLGAGYGTLGAVGVAPGQQGRGIGTALVVHAARHLRSLGVTFCHVGWLVRTSFYENAGFTPWRSYRMLRRVLAADIDGLAGDGAFVDEPIADPGHHDGGRITAHVQVPVRFGA